MHQSRTFSRLMPSVSEAQSNLATSSSVDTEVTRGFGQIVQSEKADRSGRFAPNSVNITLEDSSGDSRQTPRLNGPIAEASPAVP